MNTRTSRPTPTSLIDINVVGQLLLAPLLGAAFVLFLPVAGFALLVVALVPPLRSRVPALLR